MPFSFHWKSNFPTPFTYREVGARKQQYAWSWAISYSIRIWSLSSSWAMAGQCTCILFIKIPGFVPFQVIRFRVCHFDLIWTQNCESAKMKYHDGDNTLIPPRVYCGLRQVALPQSTGSEAIIYVYTYDTTLGVGVKLEYSAVNADDNNAGEISPVALGPVISFDTMRQAYDSDRADTRFAPNQWETALPCNDVSDWLGASPESALFTY